MTLLPKLAASSALALLVSLSGCSTEPREFSPADAERFDATLAEVHSSEGAAGAVLGIDDGEHRYVGGSGFADLEAQRPMLPSTPIRSASIAKTFTGALILSLHEEGALSVDDALADYVDGVPGADAITLRMLLTHTSGLANYTRVEAYQEAAADPERTLTLADAVALTVAQGPDAEPGEEWNYCNTGYLLLGMVAERLVGRPLHEEIRERFFEPLGIHDTFPAFVREPEGVTLKYVHEGSGLALAPVTAGRSFGADGSYFTTLDDLLVWSRAFFGGRLHDAETLALAQHSEGGELLDRVAQSFGLESGGYGLGLITALDAELGPLMAGAGNSDGVRSFVGYLPEHDISFAFYVNVGGSSVPIVESLGATGPVIATLRAHVDAR